MTSDNYPLNLLNDISGTAWGYPFPADLTQSLEYVLAGLPARERSYIRQRYEERKTYEEIGAGSGVTRERQVISITLRKLNRPDRKDFLIYGVSGMVRRANMKEKPVMPLDTPLEKLPLSARPYNALKRAGINTLGEVTALSPEDIKNIRFFGLNCYKEICGMLTGYGLSLKQGGMKTT